MISILDKFLQKIKSADLEIKNIETYKMAFKDRNIVDYAFLGRRKNLLHLVTGGKRKYETVYKTFTVGAGTLIFIPHGTKYTTEAITVNGESCSGIGICFDADIYLNLNELDIYYDENNYQKNDIFDLFSNCHKLYKSSPLEVLQLKASLYKILAYLVASASPNMQEYSLIQPAITYITEHYTENSPIKLYADKCNLSESYFRKKFLEYTGFSPIDYRNQLRFAEAKRLYQNNYSTQQIAEKTGFCDVSYMLKLYKRKNGRTLKNDAKII